MLITNPRYTLNHVCTGQFYKCGPHFPHRRVALEAGQVGRRVEDGAVEMFGLQVYETSLPVMVLESLYISGSFLEK